MDGLPEPSAAPPSQPSGGLLGLEKAALNRIGVGFSSAFCVPAAKMLQNGVHIETLNWMAALGFAIPIMVMAIVCGVYAWIIEKEETDMKRLFRMCVTLPAFMTSMASGMNPIPEVQVSTTEAHAEEHKGPAVKEVVCDPDYGFKHGLISAFSTLTDHKYKRYWLLSRVDIPSDHCVKMDGKCWYIVRAVDETDPDKLYMDKLTCKMIGEKEQKPDVHK